MRLSPGGVTRGLERVEECGNKAWFGLERKMWGRTKAEMETLSRLPAGLHDYSSQPFRLIKLS